MIEHNLLTPLPVLYVLKLRHPGRSRETHMPRVLVVGDARGQFGKIFAQVTKIQNKSGTFDALFCVGTFFDPKLGAGEKGELAPFLSGEVLVPVPTFFICGEDFAGTAVCVAAHGGAV